VYYPETLVFCFQNGPPCLDDVAHVDVALKMAAGVGGPSSIVEALIKFWLGIEPGSSLRTLFSELKPRRRFVRNPTSRPASPPKCKTMQSITGSDDFGQLPR
jgi:hypothetical protein